MFLGLVTSKEQGGLGQFFDFINNIDSTYWGRELVSGRLVVVVVGGATVVCLMSTGLTTNLSIGLTTISGGAFVAFVLFLGTMIVITTGGVVVVILKSEGKVGAGPFACLTLLNARA